jgi:hypothetical protein
MIDLICNIEQSARDGQVHKLTTTF